MMKINGVIITGGSGLLGSQYAEAVLELGYLPIILDIKTPESKQTYFYLCDITNEEEIKTVIKNLSPDIQIVGLINNAAIDPKFDNQINEVPKARLEAYSIEQWNKEIAVGLTGAMLCTKHFGALMAKNGYGSIINVSSVLGLVAPNQDLYKKEELDEEFQPVKPVSYSVIKHGIIGLSKYTSTYWAHKNVRCNTICPGGVYTNHSKEFVDKLTKYIPMRRMANKNEYNELIKFLLTDASSFINGAVISADGGQTTW